MNVVHKWSTSCSTSVVHSCTVLYYTGAVPTVLVRNESLHTVHVMYIIRVINYLHSFICHVHTNHKLHVCAAHTVPGRQYREHVLHVHVCV